MWAKLIRYLCIVFCISCNHANSEENLPVSLISEQQFWNASLELNNAIIQEKIDRPDRFKLYIRSPDGFFLTVHVEPQSNFSPSHQDCKSRYQIKQDKNHSLLANIDIKEYTFASYEKVTYDVTLIHKKQRYTMPHVNAYKAYRNLCMDIHIAAEPGVVNFRQISRNILESIVIHDKLTGDIHSLMNNQPVVVKTDPIYSQSASTIHNGDY